MLVNFTKKKQVTQVTSKWLKFADEHTPILCFINNFLFKMFYSILGMTQNMKVSSNNVNHRRFTIFYQKTYKIINHNYEPSNIHV